MKYLVVSVLSASLSLSAFSDTNKDEKTITAEEQVKVLQMVGDDSNKLLKTGASYSLRTLNKEGKLPPFALIMKNDGSLGKLEPLLPYIRNAPIGDKVNYLRGQIKNLAEKDEIKAGALFSRGFGRTQEKVEVSGLIVESEHRNGPSTVQFIPLEKSDVGFVAQNATSTPKPRLFFNNNISSEEAYKEIKQAVKELEK